MKTYEITLKFESSEDHEEFMNIMIEAEEAEVDVENNIVNIKKIENS